MKPMFFLGIVIALFGFILMGCAYQNCSDSCRDREHDCRRLAFDIQSATDKIKEQERYAILTFEDRNAKGQLEIPDQNPTTGAAIISKWTAIKDADGRILYGREYQHKAK